MWVRLPPWLPISYMNQRPKATEAGQLNNVKIVFDFAKSQKPPMISRSEVESLIIGLTSVAESPKAKQVLSMLHTYLDRMKKKNKKFLPITFLTP
jgi:hypothetical protein